MIFEFKKDNAICISMMSGTSLDGVDAALISVSKDLKVEILGDFSLEYPLEIRAKLFELANNQGDVKDVCYLNFVVGEIFAKCANLLLEKYNLKKEDVDFISSHGQTIFHIPERLEIGGVKTKSTLQIGDISVISERTGIVTVGDFRTKDIAAGGLGAPLVPFADEILFGKSTSRAIQNIGGILNVTVLSPSLDTFAFDNGPGNMLIDYAVQKYFNESFDRSGEIALQGKVDETWLFGLLDEPYYKKIPPKTTGRELFNNEYIESYLKTAPQNPYDIVATLTYLTAKVIFDSYDDFVFSKVQIKEMVLGGGGAYNLATIKYLNELFAGRVKILTHEDFSIPNKLKEAVAFAFLGYFTLIGKPNNLKGCTGAQKSVVMGKISI